MKRHLKRALELALVPVAAAIVFVEQVLIRYLNVAMAAFARWPPVARLEAWLVGLPPWAAMSAFVAPSILILPVKVSAVFLGMHGRYGMALGAILLGKMLATAILARLYKILRPTLMRIPWYAWLDTRFFDWRDRAYAFVRALPAWQATAAAVARLKAWLAELVSDTLGRRGP